MDTILDLNCFPSGMEMFPALDMDQFKYIQKVIDESDYYVLVLSGRYGSVADDGISYTEKEFDYAVSKKIPVIALLYEDITALPQEKRESDPDKQNKLKNFYTKVSDKRLCSFWATSEELKYELFKSLKAAFEIYPRIGWVRDINTERKSSVEHDFDVSFNNEHNAVYKHCKDGHTEGPYCIRCWEVNEKLVTVNETTNGAIINYKCPQCGNETFIKKINKMKVIKPKINCYDEW